MNQSIHVKSLLETSDNGDPVFCYQVTNQSDVAIHLFDSERMPYLVQLEKGTLQVMHGVNAPDPDIDYNFIEIPLTQSLEPGATFTGRFPLTGVVFSDHYGKDRQPADLHGSYQFECMVAILDSPIVTQDRVRISIDQLIERQKWVKSEAIKVEFK